MSKTTELRQRLNVLMRSRATESDSSSQIEARFGNLEVIIREKQEQLADIDAKLAALKVTKAPTSNMKTESDDSLKLLSEERALTRVREALMNEIKTYTTEHTEAVQNYRKTRLAELQAEKARICKELQPKLWEIYEDAVKIRELWKEQIKANDDQATMSLMDEYPTFAEPIIKRLTGIMGLGCFDCFDLSGCSDTSKLFVVKRLY